MIEKIPISLGFLSDSREHIYKKYGFSHESDYKKCPFDLMMSNYKGIIDCINDDFKYFCDIDYIELKTIYNENKEQMIYNSKYKFLFNHESPGHANLYEIQNWSFGKYHFVNNNFENFIIRYKDRINNFINNLNSGKHIIFIIHRYNNNLNDLLELKNVIHCKYPNLSFEFDLLQDYNYERIYNHQLMMGISDDDIYSESKRFHKTQTFYYLHKDYNENIYRNFLEQKSVNLNDIDLKSKFLINKLFSERNPNEKFIYSLKTFYEYYKNFDYFSFRNSYKKELENLTEEETIIYWNNNFNKLSLVPNIICDSKVNKVNVLFAPHRAFNLSDGGATVQFYLAHLLDKLGVRVRFIDTVMPELTLNYEKNSIFNNIFDNDFELDDCIVIYCEGIHGNPLNAKKIVRWMLSPLGKNVPESMINGWNKNELVYHFNPDFKIKEYVEKKIEKNNIEDIYKLLTCNFINSKIINYNKEFRNGTCFAYRKIHFHKTINKIHNDNDFEITREHTQDDYINFFNKYKYFISYDPLTFLISISIMCGCIAIVHPVDGLSKLQWLHTTTYSEYLNDNNLDNIYGIAYGMEDIGYAESTIHLAYKQNKEFENYFLEKYIIPFVSNIQKFEKMENTIENNYDLSKYNNL